MSEGDSKSTNVDGNLDLTQVGNDEFDKLADLIEGFYTKDSSAKLRLAYTWEKCQHFLDGNQWIVYGSGSPEAGGLWSRLTTNKANEWIPRPTTNYIYDTYQTLKSYLIKNKPRSTVRPNTQDFRDKMAAKIATLCLEANWSRLVEETNYEYAAANLVTYGTVFKKSFWDTSTAGTVPVPRMQTIPQTDPQTGQVTGQTQIPAMDPATGQPIIDQIPLGDVGTAVVEPFRIALDPSATAMHNLGWIVEYAIVPLATIPEIYDKPGQPGYTGLASTVKEERSLSGSLRRFQMLKNTSGRRGIIPLGEGGSGGSGDALPTNSVVLKEYYEKPSQQYPKGRMVVVANHVTLYAGDSPYSGPEAGDWHPYSECRWEVVPGRFWGKGPLDDACEIQKQINSIDAVIVLTRKTMAIPQKLIPTSAGIAPGSWTGRPGQEIFYRGSAGVDAPSVIPGTGVDGSVFEERKMRIEDLKATTGAIDILKGDRPPGVTAASALNLLYEVGTGKLFPVLDRWKYFVEQDQKKQLRLVCKHYQEPRPDYIAMLISKNRDLDPNSLNQFIGADLYDNCNVVVEAGSNIPKLQAAQQAALQEAAQMGTLGLEQPANRDEYNQRMGLTGFDADVGPDRTRAEWENDILNGCDANPQQQAMVMVLQVDKDDVHIDVHSQEVKKPAFMQKPAAIQQAFMQHLMQHMQAQSQKAQVASIEAMAHGSPIGPAPQQQQGTAPTPIRKAGGTTPQPQKNALKTDMLQGPQPGGQK